MAKTTTVGNDGRTKGIPRHSTTYRANRRNASRKAAKAAMEARKIARQFKASVEAKVATIEAANVKASTKTTGSFRRF